SNWKNISNRILYNPIIGVLAKYRITLCRIPDSCNSTVLCFYLDFLSYIYLSSTNTKLLFFFSEKPGNCPDEPQWGKLHCKIHDQCNNDHDCPYDQKCCKTRCGFECKDVQSPDKPGQCPAALLQWGPEYCNVVDKCHNDYDCPGDEKCCKCRCGLQCVDVNNEKPGNCPDEPQWGNPHCKVHDQCRNDFHCPKDEKCCKTRCGFKCKEVQNPGNL
uniref:WAP domain-containing protein n=1 Tax=Gouania willdenowi TaxID=441366 RepID=A0A8C5DDL9_GOUWI